MLEEGDTPKKKPSIDELERMLERDEDVPIQILPNGEIRKMDGGELPEGIKPITMREDLGGEYQFFTTLYKNIAASIYGVEPEDIEFVNIGG